jgi:hypothetical protein
MPDVTIKKGNFEPYRFIRQAVRGERAKQTGTQVEGGFKEGGKEKGHVIPSDVIPEAPPQQPKTQVIQFTMDGSQHSLYLTLGGPGDPILLEMASDSPRRPVKIKILKAKNDLRDARSKPDTDDLAKKKIDRRVADLEQAEDDASRVEQAAAKLGAEPAATQLDVPGLKELGGELRDYGERYHVTDLEEPAPGGPAPVPPQPKPVPEDDEDPQQGVRDALKQAKEKIFANQAEINEHAKKRGEFAKEVNALYERVTETPRSDPGRPKLVEQLNAAQEQLKELNEQQEHRVAENDKVRRTRDRLQAALDEKTYDRPKFTAAERATVWQNALNEGNGKVISPSGKEIKPGDPWVMGHRPKFEFRKHVASAAKRGISREQFVEEFKDLSQYRPETPEDSASHFYEDKTDAYLGY